MNDHGIPAQRCDICVIGTGAGGGILSYRLAMAGFSVLTLEQGAPIDRTYFSNHQRPEQQEAFGIPEHMPWPMGANNGYFYANARAHRLYADSRTTSTSPLSEETFTNRQIIRLNGKLNVWGGVALRFSKRDFRGRDHGDADVNWPFGYEELEPHYDSVERLIGVCGNHDGLDVIPDGQFIQPQALRPADRIVLRAVATFRDVPIHAIANRKAVETRPDRKNVCQNCGDCIHGCHSDSVYKFSSHLLPQLSGKVNYRLLCHSKVIRLLRYEGRNRIRAAECLDTRTHERFLVEAELFVLCAGALETPRLLLNSRDAAFPEGLANRSGLVGCYLQDSMKLVVGSPLLKLIGNRETYKAGFSDGLLVPRFLFENREFRGGFQALISHFLPKYPYYVEGLQAYPSWLKKRLAKALFRTYVAVILFGKAEVQRSNRITVSKLCDIYGMPQLDVHYSFCESDWRMQRSMLLWGKRILRKCSGYFPVSLPERIAGAGIHYAGTCRMADRADEGVVDPNLQCFDHDNLYVGDASVLPDMPEKNLTLTIMALAERLANRLVTNHSVKLKVQRL